MEEENSKKLGVRTILWLSRPAFWRWLFFSVVFGIIPLLATFVISVFLKRPFSVLEVLSHGELLIVSVAIVIEALRDLQYANGENSAGFRTVIQWGALFVIVGACLCFAVVAANDISVALSIGTLLDTKNSQEVMKNLSALKSNYDAIDKSSIMYSSFIIFIAACLVGGACN